MEHLHTLIISVIFAGIISYFLPSNDNQSKIERITISKNDSSISPEIILSWLDDSNFQPSSNLDTLFVKNMNQFLILDLPNHKQDTIINTKGRLVLTTPKYWEIVHSIESKQGKILYRPRNSEKSCIKTTAPCGHFQISVQALKDIGCTTEQCKLDRENLPRSLAMSQKLENINLKRLERKGYSHLPEYQKYLIHQQGATGIRLILDAQEGRYKLGTRLIKNMANNSSYSYKKLKNMGSKLAAQQFLAYWENKWDAEIEIIFDNQLKQQMAIKEYLQVASNTLVP